MRVEVNTEVDISIDDVLDELTDSDLLDEVSKRGLGFEPPDMEDIRHKIITGDIPGAIIEIDYIINQPKDMTMEYRKACANRDPLTGCPVIQ